MKKVHVYANTHWDYEWYFTANESIIQLIYHMDEVIEALETDKLSYYFLDGQVSILEEYLKYVPKNLETIKKLVREKKLLIGPWFTQTDELIISGESIVRNLFYGIKTSLEFGNYMNVGYLPDSFGQSQDLPKILNGFNIKNFIFWRGLSKDVCSDREFLWSSDDGSEVLTYNIKNGYYYGGNIIYNDDIKTVEKNFLDGVSKENILLSVGGDQRYVDFNLKDRIKFYNAKTDKDILYVESNCEDFFKELRKENDFRKVTGEFLSPSNSKIHRSIYSSRYDHKYLNDKIERKLIYHLEPLMVMGQSLGLVPKVDMLEQIWKKLLLNHAHDSACGCNSDKTNRSISSRLIDVDQLSYSAYDYIIKKICESIEDKKENDVFIFNTLPYRRENPIKLEISTKSENFILQNSNGKNIKYDVISKEKVYRGSIKRTEGEHNPDLYYYITKIYVNYQLTPFSLEKITVNEIENIKTNEKRLTQDKFIEDSFYKIYFENETITIFDKKNNNIIKNAIYLEDDGDDGDTYDYSPPILDKKIKHYFKEQTSIFFNESLVKTLKINNCFKIPLDLKNRENEILNEEINYELTIELNNSGNIITHLTLENTAFDHRMRAVINADVLSLNSIADTPFGTIERLNKPEHLDDWKEIGWKEEPSPIYPFLNFVSLKNKEKSAIVMSKGIKEYEILENNHIALTLFRSVGFLGKPDLIRRPGIASGQEFKYIETPDSQLMKKMTFKFAIRFDKQFDARLIKEEYQKYSTSLPYYQVQNLNLFTNTLKYFVMHPLKEKLKSFENLIDFSVSKLSLSSIFPVDEKSYGLRVVNLNSEEVDGSLKINFGKYYEIINMLNEKIGVKQEIKNSKINISNVKKGEIINIKIYI
ncbi:glycoside hydrolase family 38 N-terminal domain-containing protein [Candidatus Cetobacterium colombiensis]|uniref:Glycoside hydrolase family 38 C-terminal domain-containing protein n=1 Tax=Candidatus Cetobacterium colombiensis TaxID=3073100 RepID=A0ABU4W9B0_9FUSO|nr:glycoside hydrolase family 38 C-terminal domain-containing protein [Candidatus Cetobacterium colombiensis]MDX8336119.1 glycoside hydrolase family 38 C-terminal domain-containing protein [Candidatus Cetobacterium colombiensis]